jgi:tetratricopeptide (TPR) repeat protein
MQPKSRLFQSLSAVVATVLLLTGALNLRSAVGRDEGDWGIDSTARSPIDILTGASARATGDLDLQISAYQEQLRAQPDDAMTAAALGHAYIQKSRETGDPSYYPKAEILFADAFDRDDRNDSAAIGLGVVALARHDFDLALEWGDKAIEINPYSTPAYGVKGDALIELGRYDEAVTTIQKMVGLRPDLASFARVSYLRELHGDIPGAIDAMQRAAAAGAGRAENLAWTQAQLGNLYLGSGDLTGAERSYNASLDTMDGYVYGIASLGKVAAALGDEPLAIDLLTDAVQRMPLPEFVIALGEIYQAAGQPEQAAEQFALVQAMIGLYSANGVDTDIELALFLADHGSNPAEAVEKATAGYVRRPSVKSADVLAWSLYQAGDLDGAWTYSQRALHLGTQDATMLFHAGMIANARGDSQAASTYLTLALALNPHFSPIYAPIAQSTLASLRA